MPEMNMFAEYDRYEKLSKMGDNLERLNRSVDWDMFRPILDHAFKKESRTKAGRPPYDFILLFKILVLQRCFNLSDDQTEYQINDRMSFMRFLGLSLSDRVPDAKTIWLFREKLTNAGIMDDLFAVFRRSLEEKGIITRKGSIVDATFVEAPRQRNTLEENEAIKNGRLPEGWDEDTPESKHRLSQKDTDARYTKKGGKSYYGYKDHVKADADSKMVVTYEVTNAAVHDSRMLTELVDDKDKVLYADSAYSGKKLAASLPKKLEKHICRKGCRHKKLTSEDHKYNNTVSKTRSRIEHIFGFMTRSMNGITVRSKGIKRAKCGIGLMNLAYNMSRLCTLLRQAGMETCPQG